MTNLNFQIIKNVNAKCYIHYISTITTRNETNTIKAKNDTQKFKIKFAEVLKQITNLIYYKQQCFDKNKAFLLSN